MPIEQQAKNILEFEGHKIDLGDEFKHSGKVGVIEIFTNFMESQTISKQLYEALTDSLDKIVQGHIPTILSAMMVVGATTLLFSIIANRSSSDSSSKPKPEKPPIVLRDFTIEQLREFNGESKEPEATPEADAEVPIYVGLRGTVYDISDARAMYGKGSTYHCFAGRESTRAMAKFSFEEADLANPYKSDDLGLFEQNMLNDWCMKFDFKYPVVGKVSVPPSDLRLTKEQLAKYDGTTAQLSEEEKAVIEKQRVHPPVYVAIQQRIVDVSYGGYAFYGPGGPYAGFAGKDITRALATMSLKPEDITAGANMENPLQGLTQEQMKILNDWEKKLIDVRKYPVVGTLITQ